MTASAQTTVDKNVKSKKEKSEKVVVNQHGHAPTLDAWSKDLEHMMDDMVKSWSQFSKLMPFSNLSVPTKLNAENTESWKTQADRYFEDLNRRWREVSALNPVDMFRVPNGFLYKLKVDIHDEKDAYIVTAELPGMNIEDINLSIENEVLTISGKKSEDQESQGCVRERRYGSFLRSFSLPDTVDTDNVDAQFLKGVLTVTLSKKESTDVGGKNVPIRN